MFLWVFGQLPFDGAAPFLVYESIRTQELRMPETVSISEGEGGLGLGLGYRYAGRLTVILYFLCRAHGLAEALA